MRLFRYVARDYAVTLVVLYVLLSAFFSIFELSEFARITALAGKEFSIALRLTFWNLAVLSRDVAPLASLVSVIIIGTTMSRRGEIVATLSAGISPLRLVFPIIAVCTVYAGLVFLVHDFVTPGAVSRIDTTLSLELGRRSQQAAYFARPRQWFRVNDKFVRVEQIDAAARTYHGVQIFDIQQGRVLQKTEAETVVAVANDLVGSKVMIERYPKDGSDEITREPVGDSMLPLDRHFNAFLDMASKPATMRLRQLDEVSSFRLRHGYDPSMYQAELYGRILFPFVLITLTLLGSMFAFAPSSKRPYVQAIGEVLGVTLFAFLTRQAWRSLAGAEIVTPQMGAVGPALTLLLGSVYLFLRTGLPRRRR